MPDARGSGVHGRPLALGVGGRDPATSAIAAKPDSSQGSLSTRKPKAQLALLSNFHAHFPASPSHCINELSSRDEGGTSGSAESQLPDGGGSASRVYARESWYRCGATGAPERASGGGPPALGCQGCGSEG